VPAKTAAALPAPAQAKPAAKPAPANAAQTNGVAIRAPKAHVSKPRAASAKHQLREVSTVHPKTPHIRPEMLDACVVAMRRMGGPTLQSVGVTSSVRGEGRSTVAAALAVIQASECRRRTILVEFDGHKAPAAREFGLAEGPGVAEVIRGDVDVEDCIQWVTDELGVVVAGADPSMATLLRGSTAEDIVEALSRHADTLVLDLPPLEKGAGGVQLVDLCEAVALVVRAGVSTRRIEEAASALTTPPFVILNGVKSAAPRWVQRLLGMR
jgi:Mrp family chromosome partitioning ATPase